MTSTATDPLDRLVQLGRLLELYGELLTERQREFARLHYCEDMSFGEIGRLNNVTRQAVHDAVRHAVNSLNRYESRLQLAAEQERLGRQADANSSARHLLERLLADVRQQDVIDDPQALAGRLEEIIATLPPIPEPDEEFAGHD